MKSDYIEQRINKVIELALSEVGYQEGSNNKNKFAAELDSIDYYKPQKKQNVSWCSIFVTDMFYKAFGLDCREMLKHPVKNNYAASCAYQYEYYKKYKETMKNPIKGCQIFFKDSKGNINHTGLVYKVDSKKVYTIEGNKSNQVKKCSYNLNSTKIYGYAMPDYWFDYEEPEPIKPSEPVSGFKKYKVIAISGLNVRARATTQSRALKTLRLGTIIEAKEAGDWLKLKTEGYVYKKWTKEI